MGVFVTIAGFTNLNEYIVVPGLPFILTHPDKSVECPQDGNHKRKEGRGDMEGVEGKEGRKKDRIMEGKEGRGLVFRYVIWIRKNIYCSYTSPDSVRIPDLVHALACGSQVGILTM